MAGQLKVPAHPARLKIVDVLAARGTSVCGEIVDVPPLAQATVSQHLKILKDAGLLEGTIEGLRSCYDHGMVDQKPNWQPISALPKIAQTALSCD